MVLPTQGMMLSERPSASVGGSAATTRAGTTLTLASSIGNYKGVMLCNRPFTGTAASAKGGAVAATNTINAFVTGKVKTEMGYPGRNFLADKQLRKRAKKETALTRHKRWLVDLQLTKQALEKKYLADQRKKEEISKRFVKREARMRKMNCGCVDKGNEGGDARAYSNVRDEERGRQAWAIGLDDEVGGVAKAKASDDPQSRVVEERIRGDAEGEKGWLELATSRSDSAELCAAEKRRKRDGNPCRPKWAMTEARAKAEDEMKHEHELKELLEFTRGLNFAKYIRDAEIQAMIDQVKKRIFEIEGQPELDEGFDVGNGHEEGIATDGNRLDDNEAKLEAKIVKLTDENLRHIDNFNGDSSVAVDLGNDGQQEDNMSIARTVLSEGGWTVRSIHSERSLAAVAEKVRENISSARASGVEGAPSRFVKGEGEIDRGIESTDVAVNEVMMVTHKDDDGLRLGGKNTVSNLPYIRRNPAV